MTDVVVDTETGEITEPGPVDETVEPVENETVDDDELTELEDEDALGDEEQRQVELQQKAQTERELEAIQRKLDTLVRSNAKRVMEIMGGDGEALVMCPLCNAPAPGFIFPSVASPDRIALVKEAIGEPASPNYQGDRYSRACEDCDGLGAVSTGSKVAGQGNARCITCNGNGWIAIGPERAGGAITTPSVLPAPVNYNPPPLDAPDPPEVAALKQLGYIVVPPPQPVVT